jgi:hypothetical protein
MGTMTRKHWAIVLMLVACAGVVGAWLLWPRTAITRENAAKIEPGMTVAEVEAIFGGPARDEITGAILTDENDDIASWPAAKALFAPEWPSDHGQRILVWQSDQVIVEVYLWEGIVTRCLRLQVRRDYESPVDALRRWVGL